MRFCLMWVFKLSGKLRLEAQLTESLGAWCRLPRPLVGNGPNGGCEMKGKGGLYDTQNKICIWNPHQSNSKGEKGKKLKVKKRTKAKKIREMPCRKSGAASYAKEGTCWKFHGMTPKGEPTFMDPCSLFGSRAHHFWGRGCE